MKYYKVIALTCSGRGNKIHRAGDIVPEDQLEPKAVQDLLQGNFIEAATEKDLKAWKEAGNKTQEQQIEESKKQAGDAEKQAQAELDAVKKDFMEVSGLGEDDLNKTWGVPKFTKEIKALLTAKYNSLAGDDAEDVTALNNEELKAKIAELPSEEEVKAGLVEAYNEAAGDAAEDVSELSIADLRAKIAELNPE